MIISHNEAELLCRKAFEARGVVPGLREDAAANCAWLARHGLPGLELAVAVLRRTDGNPALPAPPVPALDHHNLAGSSLLFWLQALLEWHLANNGDGALVLHNARDPLAALAVLHRCGGILSASWNDRLLEPALRETTGTLVLDCRSDAAPLPPPPALAAAARRSLEQGIEVPAEVFEELQAEGRGVLVPASEASRRGAGCVPR